MDDNDLTPEIEYRDMMTNALNGKPLGIQSAKVKRTKIIN